MTGPVSSVIDLNQLDLDYVHTSEYEVPAGVESATRFGVDDLVVRCADPDRLEAFAEHLMDAAKNLRIVLGDPQASDGDEIAAFPKAVGL